MLNQEKIDKIYEVIADKTEMVMWGKSWNFQAILERPKDYPVMIWDVLDWIQNKIIWWDTWVWYFYERDVWDWVYLALTTSWYYANDLGKVRKHKRKPIEDQTDETIDFVYSLVKDV